MVDGIWAVDRSGWDLCLLCAAVASSSASTFNFAWGGSFSYVVESSWWLLIHCFFRGRRSSRCKSPITDNRSMLSGWVVGR